VFVCLFFADCYLVGLGAVVALVVYPSFKAVGLDEWQTFHESHSRSISWAVGPIWLLQGFLSAMWILQGPDRSFAIGHGLFALSGVLVTIFGAIPQHEVISKERTLSKLQKLQFWHYMRSLSWLAATGFASLMLNSRN